MGSQGGSPQGIPGGPLGRLALGHGPMGPLGRLALWTRAPMGPGPMGPPTDWGAPGTPPVCNVNGYTYIYQGSSFFVGKMIKIKRCRIRNQHIFLHLCIYRKGQILNPPTFGKTEFPKDFQLRNRFWNLWDVPLDPLDRYKNFENFRFFAIF